MASLPLPARRSKMSVPPTADAAHLHQSFTNACRPRNDRHAISLDHSDNDGDEPRLRGRGEQCRKDNNNFRPFDSHWSPKHGANPAPHDAAYEWVRRDSGADRAGDNRPGPARHTNRDRYRDSKSPDCRPTRRSRNAQRSSRVDSSRRHTSVERPRDRDDNFRYSLPDARDSDCDPRSRFYYSEAASRSNFQVALPHQSDCPPSDRYPDLLPTRPSPDPANRHSDRNPFATESHTKQSQHRRGRSPRRPDKPPYNGQPSSYKQRRQGSPFTRRDSRTVDDDPNFIPLGTRRASRREPSPFSSSGPRRHSPTADEHWTSSSQSVSGPLAHDLPIRSHDFRGFASRRRDQTPSPPPPPPSSPPRDQRGRIPKRRRRRDRTPDLYSPPRGSAQPVSGANSIQINMSGRGNFRGAYGGQYPVRGHYNQGQNQPAAGSSYSSSAPASSGYSGGGRGNWSGQQQGSSQK